MIAIGYDYGDGVRVMGTSKDDGSAPVIVSAGGRWTRQGGGFWYLPKTRDRAVPTLRIHGLHEALTKAGFEVSLDIDASSLRRGGAELEADRREHVEERGAYHQGKAAAREAESMEAYEAERATLRRFPMGQPILVDHPSGARQQANLSRADRLMDRGMEAARKAERHQRLARAAGSDVDYRETPYAVGVRIHELETQIKATEREAARQNYSPEFAAIAQLQRDQLSHELDYWKEVRARQIADGQVRDFGPDHVRPGDEVLMGDQWFPVVRASAKSVTVRTEISSGRVPWHQITGHRPAQGATLGIDG